MSGSRASPKDGRIVAVKVGSIKTWVPSERVTNVTSNVPVTVAETRSVATESNTSEEFPAEGISGIGEPGPLEFPVDSVTEKVRPVKFTSVEIPGSRPASVRLVT